MLVETIKNKIQGVEEKVTPKKFEMPEYITDGNNAYVQRFKRRWDLNIELLYDCKSQRAVFPIYKNGRVVDAIGRALYNAHLNGISTEERQSIMPIVSSLVRV